MTTEIDTVITRFETDATRAVAELQRLKVAQDAARASSEDQGAAFTRANAHAKSLGETLRMFAREQRQEGAAARYFVNEFASFIPVGSKWHDVTQSMAAGLVGGMGLGLAIEGVGLGVKWLTESFQHSREELDATKRAITALTGQSAKDIEDLRRRLLILQGVPEATLDFKSRLAAIDKQIAEASKKFDSAGLRWWIEDDARAAIDEAKKARAALYREFSEAAKLRVKVTAEEKQKEADAKANEDAKRAGERYAEWERDWLAERWQANDTLYKKLVSGAQLASSETLAELKKSTIAFAGGNVAFDPAAASEEERYAQMIQNWADEIRAADDQIAESNRELRESFRDLGRNGFGAFASSAGAALGSVARHSAAYERAMAAAGETSVITADLSGAAFAKMAQDALASIAEEAVVRAIFETAMGFGSLAIRDMPAATQHFTAAAKFGAAAAVAGVSSYAIGETRGMTADERAAVDSYRDRSRDTGSDYGSSAESGGGRSVVINNYWTGQALVTPGEVQKYLADQYREAEVKGWLDPSGINRSRVIARRRALLQIR